MPQSQSQKNHRYAVIMAGGSGTRLWPLSRSQTPKQFRSFVSEKTLIQETFSRLEPLVPAENIFISTGKKYTPIVLDQLPSINAAHLIVEPLAKNTAPAIIYIAAMLAHHDPEAIIATVASDHAIENGEEFTRAIDLAFSTIESHPNTLATIGINPTHPDTSYGYIRMGKPLNESETNRVFFVENFKEKPDLATAETYLSSWEYLWNAGYFIFPAKAVRSWVQTYIPELRSFSDALQNAIDHDTITGSLLLEIFSAAEPLPIDTVLAERLPITERIVVPSTLRWSDIGDWNRLYTFLAERHIQDMIVSGPHLDLESKNCFIHGEKRLIVTAGLKDIIVVDTDDALLVADRNTLSQNMKNLLSALPEDKR